MELDFRFLVLGEFRKYLGEVELKQRADYDRAMCKIRGTVRKPGTPTVVGAVDVESPDKSPSIPVAASLRTDRENATFEVVEGVPNGLPLITPAVHHPPKGLPSNIFDTVGDVNSNYSRDFRRPLRRAKHLVWADHRRMSRVPIPLPHVQDGRRRLNYRHLQSLNDICCLRPERFLASESEQRIVRLSGLAERASAASIITFSNRHYAKRSRDDPPASNSPDFAVAPPLAQVYNPAIGSPGAMSKWGRQLPFAPGQFLEQQTVIVKVQQALTSPSVSAGSLTTRKVRGRRKATKDRRGREEGRAEVEKLQLQNQKA